MYEANTSNAQADYKLFISDGNTASDSFGSVDWVGGTGDQYADLPLAYLRATSTYRPHGDTFYVGRHADRKYFWVDVDAHGTTLLDFVLTGVAATNNEVKIILYRYTNGQSAAVATAGNTAATAQVLVDFTTLGLPSGYYAFGVMYESAVHILNATYSTTSSVFAHRPAGTLDNSVLAVGRTRVISASLMYTNTSSPLNRQGNIAGIQFGREMEWYDFAALGYDEVANRNDSTMRPLDNGMYGWLKPTDPDDFNLKVGNVIKDATLQWGGYDLDDNSEYLLMIARCDLVAGRDGQVTICHHVEYETTDTWRSQKNPNADPETYNEAMLVLSAMSQFSSNAGHLQAFGSRVAQMLGRGLRAFELNVPKVVEWAVKNGPTIAKYAGAAAALL